MRFLFYLPAVTPWWFENIILPLAEKWAADFEVHILAPKFWQGTGIGQQQVEAAAYLPQLIWHIVNDGDHPSMRTDAVQRDQIVAFVEKLGADFVLCRAADFETTKRFPGMVRHITEGGADPLLLPVGAVTFAKTPFDHGLLPKLKESEKAKLNALIAPYWEPLINVPEAQLPAQSAFRSWAGLPYDRPTLFVPLEYEHAENFYTIHRVGPRPNAHLVKALLEEVKGRAFLALTNHPLNDLYVDNSGVEELARAHPAHLTLLPNETPSGGRTTAYLMRAADGALLGDSKCYSLAGLCGTPMLRQSRFATGSWLNAGDDLDSFLTALGQGNAAPPDREAARIWFAYHAANNLIYPKDSGLTGADLLQRLTKPFDPDRWEKNLNVFAVGWVKQAGLAA